MKQSHIILSFVAVNALFIFLLVHKQSQIIQLRYKIQKLQNHEKELLKKEQHLLYILQEQQELKKVKTFALDDLKMQPIKLKEVENFNIDVTDKIKELESKIKTETKSIYSNLSGWQKVQLSRHPERPYTLYYINKICKKFINKIKKKLFLCYYYG